LGVSDRKKTGIHSPHGQNYSLQFVFRNLKRKRRGDIKLLDASGDLEG